MKPPATKSNYFFRMKKLPKKCKKTSNNPGFDLREQDFNRFKLNPTSYEKTFDHIKKVFTKIFQSSNDI